jgi:hypothetical protein
MNKWHEEILADKTIVGVKIKNETLWLQVKEGGWIEISVSGDCCSEAFIDSVRFRGTPKLTGNRVEIELPSQPTTQEADELVAVSLECDQGCVFFLHRNSSNGYYTNFLSINSRGEPPADAVNAREWYRESVAVKH